jgi:tyrosyl-tRNA synthetase
MASHEEDKGKRIPQRRLAQELVSMIHGEAKLKQVETGLGALYGSHREALAPAPASGEAHAHSSEAAAKQHPITSFNAGGVRTFLPESAVHDKTLASVIHSAGLASSRGEANRLIIAGGAYVGSQPGRQLGWRQGGTIADMGDSLKFLQIQPWGKDMTKKFILDDNVIILRAGKWRVKVIELLPDAVYLERGLPPPPGWYPPGESPDAPTHTPKAAAI